MSVSSCLTYSKKQYPLEKVVPQSLSRLKDLSSPKEARIKLLHLPMRKWSSVSSGETVEFRETSGKVIHCKALDIYVQWNPSKSGTPTG